jgi:hypothetical protein
VDYHPIFEKEVDFYSAIWNGVSTHAHQST